MLLRPISSPNDVMTNAIWHQSLDGIFDLDLKTSHAPCPLPSPLPDPDSYSLPGFPKKLFGDLCWDGRTFGEGTSQYMVNLSKDDVKNIEAALHSFRGMGARLITHLLLADRW
jgi:hypothetical protein